MKTLKLALFTTLLAITTTGNAYDEFQSTSVEDSEISKKNFNRILPSLNLLLADDDCQINRLPTTATCARIVDGQIIVESCSNLPPIPESGSCARMENGIVIIYACNTSHGLK